ncbi:MAG: FecR domain-containing protein, partial [Thermodesulfobacteriota bacterium]
MKPKPSCSSKSHFLPSAILASFLILFSPLSIAFAQEKIAVISKFSGEVKVIHEGKELVVERIGNRIKNSSVYSNDTVLTIPRANANLVFLDNSRLEVKENTTMTVVRGQVTDKASHKQILRNIKLDAGNLWAHITSSKSVLTKFETPSGTAYAIGTDVGVGFDPATCVAIIELGEGLVYFV